AERAKRIRFGTGVISLAYHNPLWVADRLMLLDHLTHGRVIGGMGPGSLPSDSAMIGLTPTDTRELLETHLDIVVRLLAGETVTAKTPTHELIDGRLQLAPYSSGGIPLAWLRSPHRRVHGWRASMASACSQSGRHWSSKASTHSPITGALSKSARPRSGRRSTAAT